MPAIDTIGDVVRATFATIQPGPQLSEFNVHYTPTSIVGGWDSRTQLLTALHLIVDPYMANVLHTTSRFYGIKLAKIFPLPAPMPVEDRPNVAGVLANSPTPSQTRPLISWTTDLAGRAFRGRIYLPSPDSSRVDATTVAPTPALVGLMVTLGSLLGGNIPVAVGANSTRWIPVIAHRSKTVPRVYTFTPITGSFADTVFATQRRSGGTGRVNVNPW
jgi:hypothetical protein